MPWAEDQRVIPVITIDDPALADPLADALLRGGCTVAEITMRTPAGLPAIAALAARTDITVGAGTVVTTVDAHAALGAGARFLVAPGFDPDVSRASADADVPLVPGAVTSTEVQRALAAGHTLLKFFPAETSGGIPTVRALGEPFAHLGVRFMPTGGVTADSLVRYLECPAVAAVGGTWLAPRTAVSQGRWQEITERTTAAVRLAAESQTEDRHERHPC